MDTFTLPQKTRPCVYSVVLALVTLVIFQGCSGFSHLTATDNIQSSGPSAKDCGGCHVDQYQEWQGSVHNLAYSDPLFREATGDYDDESCLPCHAPASIRAKELSRRSYNLHEGISCTACHLDAGTMHGPHPSSALISPHPVTADPDFYKSSSLCGVCHEETFATWQESVQKQPDKYSRDCQQCHMAQLTRTSTKGTNLFSRMLVSFEKKHDVRSHTIALSNMANFPDGVQLHSESTETALFQIRITNQLPHNLPGGEYTESTIVLVVTPTAGTTTSPLSAKPFICDTDAPLAPGESRQVSLQIDSFSAPLMPSTEYFVQLLVEQTGKPHSLQLAKALFTTGNTTCEAQ